MHDAPIAASELAMYGPRNHTCDVLGRVSILKPCVCTGKFIS